MQAFLPERVHCGAMTGKLQGSRGDRAIFAGVAVCFVLSGFAALLYQTAWMRQLSTVFGTSELAVATVLAAYMAGLAFGAAVAARYVDRIRRPILVYGILEAAIALSAIAVPYLLTLAGGIYATLFGGHSEPPDASGAGQSLYYLAASFVVLAIPTACMGATLPMLMRYAVQSDDQVGPRTGVLYALNTMGAIAGTLAAAFLLLPALGLKGSILFGAGVNLLVFLLAAWLSRAQSGVLETASPVTGQHARIGKQAEALILPIMLMSGMVTFTYEVLWTRLLAHVLGGSIVAFAVMLASFLSGIAAGSAVASRLAVSSRFSQKAFAVTQLGIAATSLVIYQLLDVAVPEIAGLGRNIALAVAMLLPATFFIGATFPLAVRILSRNENDAANASARVYSWNTLGAIAGAVIAGFVLIPILRYEGTVKLAVMVNILLALAVALAVPVRLSRLAGVAAASAILVLVAFRPAMPESFLRVSPLNDSRSGTIRYYDVGRSATVLMLERDGFFFLRTNGLPEASTDMKGAPPTRHSQRLLAALPVIARPELEKMLVIGLGGGVVAEDIPASVREFDIIELEPKVVEANLEISAERNIDPLSDPRVQIVVNDARNAMRLMTRKYDAIVSQPSHPWTAGSSHLYTREFMSLAKSRLAEDGVFLQWMNLRFVTEDLLRSLSGTLLDVFPHVRAYQFDPNVVFFLASRSPLNPELGLAMHGEPLATHGAQFMRKGIASLNDVVAALAWDTEGLRAIAGNAPLLTDDENLMAQRIVGDFENAAIPYSRVKSLIREHGPLFDPASFVFRELIDRIDFVYVGDRLSAMYAPELVQALVQSLAENGNAHAPAIRAKVLLSQGQPRRADRFLLTALDQDPDNPVAGYLILKDRGDSLADDSLPSRIAGYAGTLTDAARSVILNWEDSFRGPGAAARSDDAVLAESAPYEQWYVDAAKMRADWRIRAGMRGEPGNHAIDAMKIIDDAIALHQDLDIYGMRMAASFLAEDFDATLETARRMIWVIRTDLDFRSRSGGTPMSRFEARNAIRRLAAVDRGLQEVRDRGLADEYKLRDLDAQAGALAMRLERIE